VQKEPNTQKPFPQVRPYSGVITIQLPFNQLGLLLLVLNYAMGPCWVLSLITWGCLGFSGVDAASWFKTSSGKGKDAQVLSDSSVVASMTELAIKDNLLSFEDSELDEMPLPFFTKYAWPRINFLPQSRFVVLLTGMRTMREYMSRNVHCSLDDELKVFVPALGTTIRKGRLDPLQEGILWTEYEFVKSDLIKHCKSSRRIFPFYIHHMLGSEFCATFGRLMNLNTLSAEQLLKYPEISFRHYAVLGFAEAKADVGSWTEQERRETYERNREIIASRQTFEGDAVAYLVNEIKFGHELPINIDLHESLASHEEENCEACEKMARVLLSAWLSRATHRFRDDDKNDQSRMKTWCIAICRYLETTGITGDLPSGLLQKFLLEGEGLDIGDFETKGLKLFLILVKLAPSHVTHAFEDTSIPALRSSVETVHQQLTSFVSAKPLPCKKSWDLFIEMSLALADQHVDWIVSFPDLILSQREALPFVITNDAVLCWFAKQDEASVSQFLTSVYQTIDFENHQDQLVELLTHHKLALQHSTSPLYKELVGQCKLEALLKALDDDHSKLPNVLVLKVFLEASGLVSFTIPEPEIKILESETTELELRMMTLELEEIRVPESKEKFNLDEYKGLCLFALSQKPEAASLFLRLVSHLAWNCERTGKRGPGAKYEPRYFLLYEYIRINYFKFYASLPL
jgi:hypothetical protein